MLSLRDYAQEYAAVVVDDDGFDLEGEALRLAVERAIRAQLRKLVSDVTALRLSPFPNLTSGELAAKEKQLGWVERDLGRVVAMRGQEAA